MTLRTVSFVALLALSLGAWAQAPAPQATPEQKVRSYLTNAFMTGAAAGILSEQVVLGPQLQARLALPPGTNSAKVYDALIDLEGGAMPKVRDATPAEATRFAELQPPLFVVDAGTLSLLVRYDLQKDSVSFVEQLAPAAAARSETPLVLAQNEAAKAAETPPAYSVVEPKAPAKAKRAVKKRAARANAKVEAGTAAEAPVVANAEPLKPKGPCVIKPVMSDQDLVNCGATPHD